MNDLNVTTEEIQELLTSAKISNEVLNVSPCNKGGNNRTFQVVTPNGVYLVKKYFRGLADKRDRLASEFAFLSYAKQVAPNFVPIPYSQNSEKGVALYEFIEGSPLKQNDITENELNQAVDFFCLLNQERASAKKLPLASEAGFSIQEHVTSVGNRINELESVILSQDEADAKNLIRQLKHYWDHILSHLKNYAETTKIDLAENLEDTQKCISPSDFGFHNALMTKNGSLKFLDFEYAGWDDPTRMVNDFFSQLAVPVDQKYYDWFVSQAMLPFPQADKLIQRAKILKIIYQIKWCCIALNIFIPVHMKRRQFANPDLDINELRGLQLNKVKSLLKKLEVSDYGLY